MAISSATARRVTGVTTTSSRSCTGGRARPTGCSPIPSPATIRYTLISVDDHLVEPPRHVRGPPARAPPGPRAEGRRDRGGPRGLGVRRADLLPGRAQRRRRPQDARTGRSSRPASTRCGPAATTSTPASATWTSTACGRAVNFPSQITGFCGSVFSRCSDPELGLAVTQAWNDWFFDEWYSPHPERIVPMGITYLADAEQGAAEIRRNAARGFTAVTLPEQPHRIGMPNRSSRLVGSDHRGVRGDRHRDLPARRIDRRRRHAARARRWCRSARRCSASCRSSACAEWLWSGYAVRHPDLQDRDVRGRHRLGGDAARPAREHRRPLGLRPLLPRRPAPGRGAAPQLLVLHHRRPVDDLDPRHHRRRPHHVRDRLPARRRHLARHPGRVREVFGGLPADEIAKITHENAAALFRHPLPPPGNPHAAGLRR